MNDHNSKESLLRAAVDVAADMDRTNLAEMLVEARSSVSSLERKLDAANDTIVELRKFITAATAVLETVVTIVGAADLLTACEVVRSELLRLRKNAELPF